MFRFLLVVLGVVVTLTALAWYDYEHWLDTPLPLGETPRTFTIERGWSAARVGRELEREGILDKRHWFELYLRLGDRGGGIRSGEYVLEGDLTAVSLIETFERGRRTRQYAHTVIEGGNWRETLARVLADDHLVPEFSGSAGIDDAAAALVADEAVGRALMAAIGHPELYPEGQFFADTYRFPRGTSDLDYFARAKATLDAVLAEEWAARAEGLPIESAEEALVLASIVEKETAVPAERPLIAGVFHSRLRKGMRLQTDPTVIYGIGPSFDGDITRRHLVTDTPYNTYTRAGLPPTPIAMVGREAIRAVLQPQETTALFFVSRGDGSHQFSETLAEHEAAVRKYQLGR